MNGWRNAPSPSTIRYEVLKGKVIALTGLSKPCGALIDMRGPLFPMGGKVVKRNFSDDGLALVGLVLELSSGELTHINLDAFDTLEEDHVNLADRSWIVQGHQTLLRQGSNVSADVQACGAGGRVLMLDRIRLSASSPRTSVAQAAPEHIQPHSPAAETQIASEPPPGTPVAMQADSGTFVVPVRINGVLTLNFTVDSGAADVSIPADIVMTLTRTGTLNSADFLGEQTYKLADGSTVPSQTFVIRSLQVGDKVVDDVRGSVASVKGVPLLGQSFLSRLNSWSLDNGRHVLNLN